MVNWDSFLFRYLIINVYKCIWLLILYPASLLKSPQTATLIDLCLFSSLMSLGEVFGVFCIQNHIICKYWQFYFFLPYLHPWYFFVLHKILARTSVLNWIRAVSVGLLVLSLRHFPLVSMLAVCLSYGLYYVEGCSSIPPIWPRFLPWNVVFCQMLFLSYLFMSFVSFMLLLWYITLSSATFLFFLIFSIVHASFSDFGKHLYDYYFDSLMSVSKVLCCCCCLEHIFSILCWFLCIR